MQSADGFSYLYKDSDAAKFSEVEKADFRLKHIGFVFQQSNLLENLNAKNNLLVPMLAAGMPQEAASAHADELLSFVGLTELAGDFPDTLSGGEEQRLAVARAMANDADIILADEPTAALDSENTAAVMSLLQRLAHELGKAVIIVSHDDTVGKYADLLFEIKDKALYSSGTARKDMPAVIKNEAEQREKRGFIGFIRFYNNKRIGDKWLRRAVTLITAAVAAYAILSVNVAGNAKADALKLVNAVSDRGISLVNAKVLVDGSDKNPFNEEEDDNLFYRTDYETALSLTQEELAEIAAIPGVEKVYPRYSFVSWGTYASENTFYGASEAYWEKMPGVASITLSDDSGVLFEKEFSPVLDGWDSREFNYCGAEALVPEINLTPVLEYGAKSDNPNAGYIQMALAKNLSQDVETLIGKTLTLNLFVPVKSYAITYDYMLPDGGSEAVAEMDASVYKLVTIECEIAGIISGAGDIRLTQNPCTPYLTFIPYERFSQIVNENKDTNLRVDDTRIEKELMPSALMIYAKNHSDVSQIAAALKKSSLAYKLYFSTQDYEDVNEAIGNLQRKYTLTASISVASVSVLFAFIYFLQSRARKREIGILKALGLSKSNVMSTMLYDALKMAAVSFIAAVVIAVAIRAAAEHNIRYQGIFTIGILSVAVGFLVSVVVTIAAGIFPIISASRVDPVEAIRRVMK
jgi:ABC-type lipoprotein export system ATPase subunit/ABC-type antimicrobial peptide transport system permease subunit